MTDEQLSKRFAIRPFFGMSDDQISNCEKIQEQVTKLAVLICELTPDSREQSLAITHLEEVVFWYTSAIHRYHEDR